MTDTQFKDLDRFVSYAEKQFDLPLLAGCFADGRVDPTVPSRAVGLSLLLGEVIQTPGLSQLAEETNLPQWQRWVGYHDRISHDTFGYAANRMNPEQLRRAGRFINRKLKRGKAFEASKLRGLLVVSLDANEQFCSDHRCCEDCLSREVTCKDAQGNEVKKAQYYHKQVYARVFSPELSIFVLKRLGALIRAFGRSRRAGRVRFSAPDAPSVGRPGGGHSCLRPARLRQRRGRQAIHYS